MEMRVPPPKLKNPALSRREPPPQPPQYDAGEDLSETLVALQCLFQMHSFTWQHPRVLAYLERCKAKTRHHLTPKQLKNLLEKLEQLPCPEKLPS